MALKCHLIMAICEPIDTTHCAKNQISHFFSSHFSDEKFYFISLFGFFVLLPQIELFKLLVKNFSKNKTKICLNKNTCKRFFSHLFFSLLFAYKQMNEEKTTANELTRSGT